MSQQLQTKLLRVLQERQIRRVGDTRQIPINVRLIAASNESLKAKTRTGGFREDLYFRLAVIPIEIPPLRERMEDVPLLVQLLSAEACGSKREPNRKRWMRTPWIAWSSTPGLETSANLRTRSRGHARSVMEE